MSSGNIGKAHTATMYRCEWNRARGYQGEEVASIERYTSSGGDPSAAIPPTETLVSGLTNLPVVVDDFTQEIAKAFGMDWQAGRKVFRFLPDTDAKKALDTDYILWTAQGETSQTRWKPDRIEIKNWHVDCSICNVVAHREPRP